MCRVRRINLGKRCLQWNLIFLSLLLCGSHANTASAQSIFDDWVNEDGTVAGFVEAFQQQFQTQFSNEYQQAFGAPPLIDERGLLDPDKVFGAIGDALNDQLLDPYIEPPFTDLPSFLDWAEENQKTRL